MKIKIIIVAGGLIKQNGMAFVIANEIIFDPETGEVLQTYQTK